MAYLGIDFGTSNTVAAISKDTTSAALIPLEGNKETLPSALFFVSEDDREEGVPDVLYGRRAIKAYLEDGYEGRFMRSPKKVLGTPTFHQSTGIAGKKSSFNAIISGFLSHVKNASETYCNQDLSKVVLGRPVNFTHDPKMNGVAENELRLCAQNAGFKDILFQFEPIAAAFTHEKQVTGQKLALVADLGGGTSDFTVIELSQDYINLTDRSSHVLGNSGIRIGGTDFDERLSMKSFMGLLGKGEFYLPPMRDEPIDVPLYLYSKISDWAFAFEAYTNENIRFAETLSRQMLNDDGRLKIERLVDVLKNSKAHQILNSVEQAKFILTAKENTQSKLDFLLENPVVQILRSDFEEAIQRDILQISNALNECLKQANVQAYQINLVILTGGSTAIPIIQRTILAMFPKAEISQGNKLDSVGVGLAMESARRYR